MSPGFARALGVSAVLLGLETKLWAKLETKLWAKLETKLWASLATKLWASTPHPYPPPS